MNDELSVEVAETESLRTVKVTFVPREPTVTVVNEDVLVL